MGVHTLVWQIKCCVISCLLVAVAERTVLLVPAVFAFVCQAPPGVDYLLPPGQQHDNECVTEQPGPAQS